MNTRLLAPYALAGALALVLPPAPIGAAPIALRNGTIHEMTGRAPYVGTLVIDGDRILAVGPSVTPPADARVVDATGLHVYPGLIDAGTSLGLTEIGAVRATVDHQEIGEINPNARTEVAVNPDSELLPVARVNGVTSAIVAPRGGLIAGTSALMHTDGWTWEDMTIRAPLALHLNWPGKPGFSPWGGGPPGADPDMAGKAEEERERKIELIRDAFADARAYRTARAAMDRNGVPHHDFEPKWEAMLPVLDGRIPVVVSVRWAEDIKSVVEWAEAEKVRLILSGADDADPVIDLLREKKVPVVLESVFDFPPRRYMAYDMSFGLAGRLHAAGIPFCFSMGSEASNSRNLPYSAAMAVAFGLPADAALDGLTAAPARIFGVADRVGTLAPGLEADLLVTDGSPLELRTQVRHVFIDGREVPLTSRHTRLYEKYRNRPRPASTVPPTGDGGLGRH